MILILENAINWNTLEEAKLMILKGKELTDTTGVKTMSKFQLFTENEVVNKEHLEYCKARMLTFEQAKELFEYGKEIGQEVFFTPMYDCIDFLEELGVNYYKIRHYDRYNNPLIKKIWNTNKDYFISLSKEERFYPCSMGTSYPLFCIPEYPAWWLDYMDIKFTELDCFRGISDHSYGTMLLRTCNSKFTDNFYFERHVCLTKEDCLEAEWASTFQELEEVLK